MIVPIGVPSACKISKVFSRIAVLLTSAMAAREGGVFAPTAPALAANNPFAGCPFTATVAPITVFNAKFGVCAGPFPTSAVGVIFGFLASCVMSVMSPRYSTTSAKFTLAGARANT
jgi:hypothetical protein